MFITQLRLDGVSFEGRTGGGEGHIEVDLLLYLYRLPPPKKLGFVNVPRFGPRYRPFGPPYWDLRTWVWT